MDINILRMIVTVSGLVLFLALAVWTWNRRRRAAYDEAARLPFVDSDAPLEQAGARQ
jgi:cytochrome c oxidase cbb3-type subunit IV